MCRREWGVLAVAGALGCEQAMRDQPRIEPLEAAPYFANGMGAREVAPGAVPRGHARLDRHLWAGRARDGSLVESYPLVIEAVDLQRGEQRFNIYCMPCHGRLGEGDGMVVRRGYPAPPALTAERARTASPGYLFDVVTRGHAFMPDYDHIDVVDRWRIVAWVQVLQLSRYAPAATLPAGDRARLPEGRR